MKSTTFFWIAAFALAVPIVAAPAFAGESWHKYLEYSPESLRAREQGRVDFELVVGTDGRATECRILQSSGYPRLDVATCRQALGVARYAPSGVSFRVADHVVWTLP
jgi:protein TonB